MSTYIQWALYGKDDSGHPLPEEKEDELREMLDDEVTEWHDNGPDGECIGQFLTTYNNGYASITEIVGDFAKTTPDCMFQLFCHNEDEEPTDDRAIATADLDEYFAALANGGMELV